MVSVKMLRVKQLEYQDTNFNDKLILTLNKTRTDAIIETEFVKAVFAANWRRYQRLIIRTQLLPFICYLIISISYLTYALKDKESERYQLNPTYHLIYYPLFGCNLTFSLNQILCEKVQWRQSDYWNFWNVIDLTYTTLNFLIMIMNVIDYKETTIQT